MFLTTDDLFILTGYQRPSAQRRWLEQNGWKFEIDGNGRPVVLRSHAEEHMGSPVKNRTIAPNFDALTRTV